MKTSTLIFSVGIAILLVAVLDLVLLRLDPFEGPISLVGPILIVLGSGIGALGLGLSNVKYTK